MFPNVFTPTLIAIEHDMVERLAEEVLYALLYLGKEGRIGMVHGNNVA